jgi:hypothetical protein
MQEKLKKSTFRQSDTEVPAPHRVQAGQNGYDARPAREATLGNRYESRGRDSELKRQLEILLCV